MDTHETKIYIALSIAAIVLCTMLAYFIITVIRNHRSNLALYKEKIQAEISTLETERKRIATDLHDEIGPLLSSVRIQINCLRPSDDEDADVIERAIQYIDNALIRMRDISNNLMPHVLLRKGLVVAIREYIDNLNTSQSLDIAFNVQVIAMLPQDTEIHLYRIVQEIIHNTIKHAKARKLTLNMDYADSKLLLYVTDDGLGFDLKASLQGRGFGLSNVMSRVELLKGDVYIDTLKGKGTAYYIKIPLQKMMAV